MQEAADTVGPALSPNQIREFLYQTAQDRFPGLGKDLETGFGLIDVYAAVNAARGHNAVTPMAFPADMSARSSVPDNSEIWIDIDTLESDKPLAVTFVIDGKAGRMGWSPDLDAELYAVNGDGSLALVSASGCPAGPECGSQGRGQTAERAEASQWRFPTAGHGPAIRWSATRRTYRRQRSRRMPRAT
jgi:hypothetical protein